MSRKPKTTGEEILAPEKGPGVSLSVEDIVNEVPPATPNPIVETPEIVKVNSKEDLIPCIALKTLDCVYGSEHLSFVKGQYYEIPRHIARHYCNINILKVNL